MNLCSISPPIQSCEYLRLYLDRIGYHRTPEVNRKCLFDIQKSHLLNVPFENLDIIENIPLTFDIPKLWEKIVLKHRGGICYELNILLCEMLKRIGFDACYFSATVPDCSHEFDHMLLMVKLEGTQWLVDVGFGGGGFFIPLKFETDILQFDGKNRYKIVYKNSVYQILKTDKNNSTTLAYYFHDYKREPSQYWDRCLFFQTSEEHIFRKGRICSLERQDGRISLSDNKFTITKNGVKDVIPLCSKVEYNSYLSSVFGITL